MRKFLLFLMLVSISAMGQTDSILNVRISSKKPLPQIGLDLNGRKYFVMSTRQDKATLIELQKGLYADSLLEKLEQQQTNYVREIGLLKGKTVDQATTITLQAREIKNWERNFNDQVRISANLQKNVDSQTKYIRRKRLGWWTAMFVGAAGLTFGVVKSATD